MRKLLLPFALCFTLTTAGSGRGAQALQPTAGSLPAKPGAAAPPLNLLFIMADDHGRQAISAYGSQTMKTPNIDRLARDGVRFLNAFAVNSICSPSRANLVTGKYNCLCGVRKLEEAFDRTQPTFPKLLQQAGYQTALVGKWHLFTEPAGFDYFSVLPGQGVYKDPRFKEIGQPWGDGRNGGVVHPGYVTDIITDLSLAWLQRRDPHKPFCLMVHHKAAHSPHQPAPRHANLFQDTVFPEPSSLLDDYHGRAPEPVVGQLGWSRLVEESEKPYQRIKAQFTGDRVHDTRLMYQTYLRNYLRLVAALDENVGRLLDYLDQSGLAQNTLVIYTSDNGYFLGDHGLYNKMWMYEEGCAIPLLIRLPGARQVGPTNPQLVTMLDMAPTLLDFAGLKVPPDMQGASLKPLLLGQATPWREAFYYHYYGFNLPRTNWIASPDGELFGVRSHTAKLICYPRWKGGPFWEYFDLRKDPQERHNLYAEPARQAEITALKHQLRSLAEHYQDSEVSQLDLLQ